METVNHEYYVSPEVANLLEKAGFDWRCRKCYNKGVLFDMEPDEIRAQVPQHSSYDVLAPTLDVAQRWLREVKNIAAYACPSYNEKWIMKWQVAAMYYDIESDEIDLGHVEEDLFDTYEEAQEACIKKILEIILEKGE